MPQGAAARRRHTMKQAHMTRRAMLVGTAFNTCVLLAVSLMTEERMLSRWLPAREGLALLRRHCGDHGAHLCALLRERKMAAHERGVVEGAHEVADDRDDAGGRSGSVRRGVGAARHAGQQAGAHL